MPFQRTGVHKWKMFKNKKKDKQKDGAQTILFYPIEEEKSPKWPYNDAKRALQNFISTSGKYKCTLELILEMLKTEQWIDPSTNVPTKKSTETDKDKKDMEDEIFGIESKTEVEGWPAEFSGHIEEMCHVRMLEKLHAEPDYDSRLDNLLSHLPGSNLTKPPNNNDSNNTSNYTANKACFPLSHIAIKMFQSVDKAEI